jgi:hypothetical protein
LWVGDFPTATDTGIAPSGRVATVSDFPAVGSRDARGRKIHVQDGIDRGYNPNAFRLAATPCREDSRLIPWVEENDAEAGEVLDVSRHEGKAVFKGRGGNHTIRGTQRPARQLTHSAQSAPLCRNRLRHRQNTPRKHEVKQ